MSESSVSDKRKKLRKRERGRKEEVRGGRKGEVRKGGRKFGR